jgi:hypothetical protein
MCAYGRYRLYSLVILVYKKVMFFKIGVGIHREARRIAQGDSSFLSGYPGKKLTKITGRCKCTACRSKE